MLPECRLNPQSSVVGYQSVNVENGYSLRTPTFYSVGGGDSISIQEFKPVGDSVPTGEDGMTFVQFQLLNAQSRIKDMKTYYWHNWTSVPIFEWEDPVTSYGWYETVSGQAEGDPSSLMVKPGEAFYMQCPVSEVALSFSGEVRTNQSFLAVNAGYTLLGNPYPCPISIQSITPIKAGTEGAEIPTGEDGMTFVQFQLLNAQSRIKDMKTYYWHNWTSVPIFEWEDPVTSYGWYETVSGQAEGDPSELILQPGEGIYVQSPIACLLNIKGLELSK